MYCSLTINGNCDRRETRQFFNEVLHVMTQVLPALGSACSLKFCTPIHIALLFPSAQVRYQLYIRKQATWTFWGGTICCLAFFVQPYAPQPYLCFALPLSLLISMSCYAGIAPTLDQQCNSKASGRRTHFEVCGITNYYLRCLTPGLAVRRGSFLDIL